MSDACHTRQSNVQRSRDGLLTVCGQCARGVDLPTSRCGRGDCSVGQPRSRPRTAGPDPSTSRAANDARSATRAPIRLHRSAVT